MVQRGIKTIPRFLFYPGIMKKERKRMEFSTKLPRDKKEFSLFLLVISLISVSIIAPLITCFEIGFSLDAWTGALRRFPFLWLSVVAVVLLTYRPAEWLTGKFTRKGDSFSAHVLINILCSVFLISVFMTVFGAWIGSGRASLDPLRNFFYKWPRNFSVAFFVEACIAQPVARCVMQKLHRIRDEACE